MTELEKINQAFLELQETINLQPHQQKFCEAEQDLIFFGGKRIASK